MSTELEMIFRLRDERNRAEARALAYAKYVDTLASALIRISETQYDDSVVVVSDLQQIADEALVKAEHDFDYSLFEEVE